MGREPTFPEPLDKAQAWSAGGVGDETERNARTAQRSHGLRRPGNRSAFSVERAVEVEEKAGGA